MYWIRQAAAVAAMAGAAWGHATWVTAPGGIWRPGASVEIVIGHGHGFPKSEEAIAAGQAQVIVAGPGGARSTVAMRAEGGAVHGTYRVGARGRHRVAMVQDRGVRSRTPQGVKAGGRDVHPDAVSASRVLRTAVAGEGPALALPVEICAKRSGGVWRVTVLREGHGVAGVAVKVLTPGAEKEADAGTTDARGELRYAGSGETLFTAEWKEPAPAGAKYDTTQYETSLHVGN